MTKEILKVSIVPKGTWAFNMYYERLSLVRNGASVYLAVSPSMGIQPGVSTGWSQYWMLLVQDTDLEGADVLYSDAVKAVAGIENMTVSAVTLPANAEATATKTYNPETGQIHIEFGIPVVNTSGQNTNVQQQGNEIIIT